MITDDEFRRIVDLYIAHYGYYTPALPVVEPTILEQWRFRSARES